ncbi:protein of unknown function DUF485 [Denitrovibrio acetiphilus DSM 12809]|uniref:DUF485 domain-containing protein n=1 Tax=Denitrovibrio acetiphilus (strain DSM 12809 / NBRC 114555 / N2460) TaxID=522772 RepID=D4H791_DENA2|nr:DUF485 domain-containing protein [Denitrovibrio acetiphilus]ADD67890.1 protein of unknown function DUF485 [Denitrovibrio acetiphilus DSM 12809]
MHDVLNSERFKALIRKRWTFSFIMLMILFVIYYGYVLLIAFDKDFIAQKVGEHTTVGIYLTVGVIISAWLLTVIYVVWANKVYDKEVEELKKML